MPKFSASEWDAVRKKFHASIMADTSLVSLAQNLDTKEWPHRGADETPAKYIDFTYDELLLQPEIGGKADRADHLISILKETLAFDDPFGEMVAQVEESAAKENPVLKTLARLGIPEGYPLALVKLSEATRAVCLSEGVSTIGQFAALAQQMSTRVVIGGDFRALLNALSHGDEAGIGRFLPFRRGVPGLHLPEALGLAVETLSRAEQLGWGRQLGAKLPPAESTFAVPLSVEEQAKLAASLRPAIAATLAWFKDQREALLAEVRAGGSLERSLVVIGDPVREAIAAHLVRLEVGSSLVPERGAVSKRSGGFLARLFGRG